MTSNAVEKKGSRSGFTSEGEEDQESASSSRAPSKKSFLQAIRSYGTIVDDDVDKNALRCLQERGSIWGILNDVSLNMGGYVCLTFTMLLNLPTLGAKLKINPCKGIKDHHLSGVATAGCEYCEVYVLCFPLMTFTITLLICGRDILHKRLYYRLLLEGGVLRYRSTMPLSDFLVLMSLWSFFHVVVYVGFLCVSLFHIGIDPKRAVWVAAKALYKAVSNPSSPATGMVPNDAYTHTDPEGFTLLVHILCFVIVPGLFYLLFIFRMYPVDWTLVPLSEYIADLTEQGSEDDLTSLVVMEEYCTKAMLEKEFDTIIDPSYKETVDYKGQQRYVKAIRIYQQYHWNDWEPRSAKLQKLEEDRTPGTPKHIDPYEMQVDLLDSLWPASLVLTHSTPFFNGETGKIHWFTFTWTTFIATTFFVGLVFISYPVMILIKEILHVFYAGSYQALAPLAATLLHLITAILILHRVSRATPAWEYVKCCQPAVNAGRRLSRRLSRGFSTSPSGRQLGASRNQPLSPRSSLLFAARDA
mmetsp:Transcript_103523/g.179813  ORF Transcript_103523/g.179813 Transcript_103523/m.179813 type:complete len:528 (-) Transcript_103523:13-1596(-)